MKNSRVRHLKSRVITKNSMFTHFVINANKQNAIHLQPQQEIKMSTKGYMLLLFVMIVSLIFFRSLGLPEIIACIPGIVLSVSINNYIKSHNEKILRNSKSRK